MQKKIWNQFLTLLALAFLVAFSYPAFVPEIPESVNQILNFVQWVCWLAFAVDVGIGLIGSKDRKAYLRNHPLEIASVLLPFLRPLRLMRVLSFGGLVIKKVAVGRQFAITLKVGITSLFIAYIAAVQITILERGIKGSNIKNIEDGIWWAFTTITTVGYGDRYPTSSEGRLLAIALMIMGISLVGVITASVAAWFVKMSSEISEESENA